MRQIHLFKNYSWEVKVKVMDCSLELSEFELPPQYYAWKSSEPLSLLLWIKQLFFYKDSFDIK